MLLPAKQKDVMMIISGDLRFVYEIEYDNDFSILVSRLHTIIIVSPNMKREGSGNVPGLGHWY